MNKKPFPKNKKIKIQNKKILIIAVPIILLLIAFPLIHRYQKISEQFSRIRDSLNSELNPYDVSIKEDAFFSGTMTIQLDQNISFNYVCEVRPFGLDTGYGPFCEYRFPGSSQLRLSRV